MLTESIWHRYLRNGKLTVIAGKRRRPPEGKAFIEGRCEDDATVLLLGLLSYLTHGIRPCTEFESTEDVERQIPCRVGLVSTDPLHGHQACPADLARFSIERRNLRTYAVSVAANLPLREIAAAAVAHGVEVLAFDHLDDEESDISGRIEELAACAREFGMPVVAAVYLGRRDLEGLRDGVAPAPIREADQILVVTPSEPTEEDEEYLTECGWCPARGSLISVTGAGRRTDDPPLEYANNADEMWFCCE